MSKRDHLRACEARRDAILRAHECDATPTDTKVLDAAFWYLSEWDTLSVNVKLDHIAAIAFVIEPSRVQLWQRKRARESLRRWDRWGIVRARSKQGRPPKDGDGPVVKIGLIEVTERHPVSKALYRDISDPDARSTYARKSDPDASKKGPRSEKKVTPTRAESDPTPTLKTRTRFERSSERSYEKPLALRGDEESTDQKTNTNTDTKSSTDESVETQVRRHLEDKGHDKQTINRVVELSHEDVHHPEQWADKTVVKVAQEVETAQRRAEANVFRGYPYDPQPYVPPEERDWRAVYDGTKGPEPKRSKPKDQSQ